MDEVAFVQLNERVRLTPGLRTSVAKARLRERVDREGIRRLARHVNQPGHMIRRDRVVIVEERDPRSPGRVETVIRSKRPRQRDRARHEAHGMTADMLRRRRMRLAY